MDQTYPTPNKLTLKIIGLIVLLSVVLTVSILIIAKLWFTKSSANTAQRPNVANLQITSPAKNTATNESSVVISGVSGKKAIVTVTSGAQSEIIATDNSFSTKVNLSEGKNIVTIVAFDERTGTSQTEIRQIFYLNEDLSSL